MDRGFRSEDTFTDITSRVVNNKPNFRVERGALIRIESPNRYL